MSYLSGIIKTDLVRMKQAIDLRDDLWELGGYNIERADQGMFEEVEKRNRTFSCIRDYVTTTATTQMGQGATEVSHIDGWDIPLMPKDGRNPPSQPDHPGWDPSPIRMMNDKQQREADAQRAQQQQQQTGPSSSTAGGRDGYSSAAGSAPPPKAPPSKPRPSTPPTRKDWVIPRVPNGYLFRTSSMPDQRNSEFITSAWMDERDHFLLSIVQGPAAQAASTSGSAPWAQYLRRVTAYACMVFGVCNPGVVTEDTASTISEKDWLRCYSHIVRKYMLTRTGCYLSTAGMLMMLGHHDVNVANQSELGRIKKLITNPLACRIIEAPSGPREVDMLAGDFRAGTTILITDLMFRVGTQSGTHGIQTGLTDMGWESVEVFKIHDSESERPLQQFLETLEKVKQHLNTDTIDDGQVTVHLWLSLQFLHEQKPPHCVMLENDFQNQFIKGVIDLDQVTSRPLMVAINNDSMFNGMDSVTSRIAVELIEKMRLQGILVTSDQRMWRPMYSQFGKQVPNIEHDQKGDLGKDCNLVCHREEPISPKSFPHVCHKQGVCIRTQ